MASALCAAAAWHAAVGVGAADAAVILDLDASKLGLNNGDAVTSWGPLSQTGTPAPTFSSAGFNGRPSVVFNRAEGDHLTSAAALNNVGSIAAVVRVDSYTSLDGLISTGADKLNVRLNSTTKYRSPGNTQDGNDFSGVAAGGDLKVNNVSAGSYAVGTSHVVVATSGTNQNFPSLMLGQAQASGPAAGRFFNGAMAEVVFFDKQLTADEQTGVASILASRWGSTPIAATPQQLAAGEAALAVPEPSSAAVAAGAGLLLLTRRRRSGEPRVA